MSGDWEVGQSDIFIDSPECKLNCHLISKKPTENKNSFMVKIRNYIIFIILIFVIYFSITTYMNIKSLENIENNKKKSFVDHIYSVEIPDSLRFLK
jgi:hypothetical protein